MIARGQGARSVGQMSSRQVFLSAFFQGISSWNSFLPPKLYPRLAQALSHSEQSQDPPEPHRSRMVPEEGYPGISLAGVGHVQPLTCLLLPATVMCLC